jgi:selenium-binding protein 1
LFSWDGNKLTEQFSIDFIKEKLGRAHQMRFGAYSLYAVNKNPKPANLLAKRLPF